MRRALKKNETMKLGKVFLGSSPGLLKKFHRNWLKANWRHFVCKASLFFYFFLLPAHKMVSNVAPCKILGL